MCESMCACKYAFICMFERKFCIYSFSKLNIFKCFEVGFLGVIRLMKDEETVAAFKEIIICLIIKRLALYFIYLFF